MPYKRRTKSKHSDDNPDAGSGEVNSLVPHKTSWVVEIPIYVLAFFTPMAIGTAHLWSSTVMLGLCLTSFTVLVFRRRRQRRSFLLFPMGVALLAACAMTLVQLLPAPEFMVRLLNPGAADLYDYVLAGTGLWGEGNWRALSLDPPGTAAELIRFMAYLLAFVVVVNYFNDRHRARRLLKAVAWSGFAVAMVGFFSKLFVAQSIWGIHPVRPGIFFFSTFVNPNHLAGFLALCSPVAFGLGLSARERQDKALFGFMGVIIGVATFMTLSRGGMVAYVSGLAFLFFFVATRRARRLRRTALVQAGVAVVLALAGYLAYDTIIRELKTIGDLEAVREETKIRSWEGTLPMMADHPVIGIGKGAYVTVYPRYKTVESNRTFHHAENQLLQVMTEWGPAFGLLFAGSFLLAFGLALSRARQSFSMGGCLAGVFAVALHNLVDFNLEVGGVAFPFVVVLGVISASPFSHAGKPRDFETRPRLNGLVAKLLAPAVLLAGVVAVPFAAKHDLASATERILAIENPKPAEPCSEGPLAEAACRMMQTHPADFMAPLVLGRAYLDKMKKPALERAVHWLSRALYLNPTSAVIHRLLGRALYLAGYQDQALGEYRLAAQWDGRILTAVTMEVFRLTGDTDLAIQATPPGGEAYMKVARNLRALGKEDAAAKAARLALEQDSTLLPAMDLLARLAFQDGRFEEAAGLARQTVEVDPLHDQAYFIQGQVFMKGDKPGEAEKIWTKGLEQVPDSTLLANQLVEFYLSQARFPEAEAIAARLQSFAPSDDSNQARLHQLLGRIYEAKGMIFEARRSYRMAAGLAPDVLPYLYRVARMEEKMGNWDEAERIYKQLLAARFRAGEIAKRLEEVGRLRVRDKDRAMMETWLKEDTAVPD